MKIIKNHSGITIVALVITVVILIIIAGVSITAGTQSLEDTRLKGMYTTLEIIQKRVDEVVATNESYTDKSGNTVIIKEAGTAYVDLDDTKKNIFQEIIQIEDSTLVAENFRYFTIEELEVILDLSEMDHNVFIDFNNRIVISEDGVEANGQMHYMLENETYFVEQNTNKNVGEIAEFIYGTPTQYGEEKYKITVNTSNTIGDLNQASGYFQYKRTAGKYWVTADGTEIIVEPSVEYDVKYVDKNNNSRQEKIILEVSSDGTGTVTVTVL